ncbi:hypothetical protein M0802_004300 [Mischocyttarus mexicanus]|nr:hypothetical protein M0802_004300 [Mischocyttarus mexicanus]
MSSLPATDDYNDYDDNDDDDDDDDGSDDDDDDDDDEQDPLTLSCIALSEFQESHQGSPKVGPIVPQNPGSY